MKQKLIITAIVALAIGFFSLSGGFTKSETRHHDPCEQHSAETEYNKWHDCLSHIYYFEDSCNTVDEIFDEKNNCEPVTAWLTDETMSYQKVVFDQRRTAMFLIGGAIIGLLPLARKGR